MKLWMTLALTSLIFASQGVLAGPRPIPGQYDEPTTAAPGDDTAGLLRQNNIAPTGQTVPRPSTLPEAGSRPFEQTPIERLDNKIDSSICKGC